MSSDDKKKSALSEFKDLIESANKWAGLVAAIVAAISFGSVNRLASYVFILIACISADWFLWRIITRSPSRRGNLIVESRSPTTIKEITGRRIWRIAVAAVSILLLTGIALTWVGFNSYQDVQQWQAEALKAQCYYAPTA